MAAVIGHHLKPLSSVVLQPAVGGISVRLRPQWLYHFSPNILACHVDWSQGARSMCAGGQYLACLPKGLPVRAASGGGCAVRWAGARVVLGLRSSAESIWASGGQPRGRGLVGAGTRQAGWSWRPRGQVHRPRLDSLRSGAGGVTCRAWMWHTLWAGTCPVLSSLVSSLTAPCAPSQGRQVWGEGLSSV